ncbi:hypothetical protein ACHAW5_009458 [Stephanodiscus triporus]|uniref:Uncharacterized protein n=1 Tax=Stephanodiscus triporus TaxID=2934178 RepID=A0ABD3QCX1_9STRA
MVSLCRRSGIVKLTQTGGQKAFARPAEEFTPPAWGCGVGAMRMSITWRTSAVSSLKMARDH